MRLEISNKTIAKEVRRRVSEDIVRDLVFKVELELKANPELKTRIAKRIIKGLEPDVAKKVLAKLGVKA